MKNKFYTLVAALCFVCLLSARAQVNHPYCIPGFVVSVSQYTATFRSWDSLTNTTQHSWSFGDGSFLPFSSSYRLVYHHYNAPGRYTVVHAIRDSLGLGCHDSSIQVVVIDTTAGPPPPPPHDTCTISFSTYRDSSQLPNKAWFYANPVAHGRDSLFWYVNGVLVSTNDSVLTDSFPAGSYSVCVQLHSAGGCTATYCQYFTVGSRDSSDTTHTPPPPPPHDTCSISFGYTASASHPNEIHFMAYDSTGLDSLRWIIAQGHDTAVLHGPAPVYVFSDTGCFYVALYATTPAGCWSYAQKWVCIDSLSGNNFITSYPNPAPGQSNVDLSLDQDSRVYINIYNSMGRLVLSRSISGIRGLNHIVLPTAELPKGIYYVQIQYGNVTKRSKIQKL